MDGCPSGEITYCNLFSDPREYRPGIECYGEGGDTVYFGRVIVGHGVI